MEGNQGVLSGLYEMCPKLFMHVDGRLRKVHTASKNMSFLMSVMVETSVRMLVPPPTLPLIPRIELMTTPWVTDWCWTHGISALLGGVRHVSASNVSLFHLRFARDKFLHLYSSR